MDRALITKSRQARKEQLQNPLVPLQELPKGGPAGTSSSLPRMRNYLD